jgi:inosose dehydratase
MVTFRIGHTGILWGFSKEDALPAVRDTAELGYLAYETFGFTIEQFQDEPGGFGALLAQFNVPLSAAYCPTEFYDPADAAKDIANCARWAQLAADLGAETLVLQGGQRKEQPYPHFEGMAEAFNEIGRQAAKLGMRAAIHPHTGTLIETGEEIDTILAAVDPTLVGFAPDTGQILKGGSDPVEVLRKHKPQLWHVHLKDYGGGRETGYVGYEAIGQGVVDMPGIFEVLDEAEFDGWVMVELDGTPQAPRSPREAAALSKQYLQELLGDRATWRK